ncbi:hypothetical protein ACJ41O_002327 [Fusarium nematophilum]
MAPLHRWLQPRASVSIHDGTDWFPFFLATLIFAILALSGATWSSCRNVTLRHKNGLALRKRDATIRKRDTALRKRDAALQESDSHWLEERKARMDAEGLLASSVQENKRLTEENGMLWRDVSKLEKQNAELERSLQAGIPPPNNRHVAPSPPWAMPGETNVAYTKAFSLNMPEPVRSFPLPIQTRWSPVLRRLDSPDLLDASSGVLDRANTFPGQDVARFHDFGPATDVHELRVVEARRLVGHGEVIPVSPKQAVIEEIDETEDEAPVDEEAAHRRPRNQHGRDQQRKRR